MSSIGSRKISRKITKLRKPKELVMEMFRDVPVKGIKHSKNVFYLEGEEILGGAKRSFDPTPISQRACS